MLRGVAISKSNLLMKVITSGFRFRIGMSLAFGLIWTSAALGDHDVTFASPVNYAAGDEAYSVAIGDLDGDQVLDLAVANGVSDNVSVLRGVGDGTFAVAVHYAAGSFPTAVAIGDLNGDQILDLAVANGGTNTQVYTISILLGTGFGTFAAAVNYAADVGPRSIAVGDLNGDQVPDLAVANDHGDNVSVLLGIGDGTFAARVDYPAGDFAHSVAIADLNGDLVPDLAVANAGADFGNTVSVLLGLGDGTFAATVNYAAGEGPRSIAIGDLDGDQLPDIVVANEENDNVSVLLNQSGGACCLGRSCSIATHFGCQDSGGAFFGQNTTCEPDADGDGVRDGCDVCDGGDDNDDRDGDGVPDDCDACNNNLPDACDFVSPILAAAPHGILKNRYISIDPRGENAFNLGDVPFDIRVRLSNTLLSGVTAIGEWWWANAPDASCISIVGPTQPATPPDWSTCPTLHLTGCPIIPTSTYEIAAVVDGKQPGPPLVADTQARPADNKWWGDAVGTFTGAIWTGPQGVTNFDDVNAALSTFKNPAGVNATHVSVTDIHPNRPDLGGTSVHPNKLVSIDDVFSFIKAFQGEQYPGFALNGCTDP